MNIVDQNDKGNVFAVSYQDNGQFKVLVFDTKGKELAKINVNDKIGIDQKSTPISGFFEPLITLAFLPEEKLYVQVYHRIKRMSYHFSYEYKNNAYSPV